MRDVAGAAAALLLHLVGEGDAGAVDQAVRDEGRDDLAAQLMLLDRRTERSTRRLREIAHEIADELRVVGQIRGQQLAIERHLGIGHEDGELGPGQPGP